MILKLKYRFSYNKEIVIDGSRHETKRKAEKKMQGKYKVITLCGSTRFKDQFLEAQKKLTLQGNIVISVGLFGHSGDQEVWENMEEGTLTKTKQMLDDMHRHKIDMADEIFVINVGGYIGASTQSEIAYALASGKQVTYLENPDNSIKISEGGELYR